MAAIIRFGFAFHARALRTHLHGRALGVKRALFIKDDGRVREYLEQARGVGDEWLSAAAWQLVKAVPQGASPA